jgi:hypothetical protein
MNAPAERICSRPSDLADEALLYLEVVDVFAALDADPHAAARARAASARELQQTEATRKGVLRWRS